MKTNNPVNPEILLKKVDNSRSIIDIDVFVNGNQTINQLGKLQAEMSALRKHINEIPKDNEAFKLLEISAKNLEKTYAKLDGQLKHHIATNELNKKRYEEAEKAIKELNQAGDYNSEQLKRLTKDRDYYNKMIATSQRHIESTTLRLQENKNQMQAVQDELKQTSKHTKEYTDANEKLKLGTQEIKRLQNEVGLLGMSMRQLEQLNRELNRELKNVTHGTEAWTKLKLQINEVSAVMQHQRNDLHDTRTSWQRFKDEMRDFGTATMGNIGGEIAMRAFDGVTQALAGMVTNAAKVSDEIADMQRFTDNTKKGAEELNAELSKVYTRTGTGELRGITMVGGQLGVVKEEVKGFVVEIDKANVALEKDFNGNAEAVANTIGSIKSIYEETKEMNWQEAIGRIGSAITSAGSISAANAPQISDFVQRIGAIGELGPKLTENLGLGAALLDLGLTSEIASSGLQALFITAGKEAEAFAKQIGISKEEFIKLQNENPNEMLLQVAKSFKGLSNSEVMAGLQKMGITSGETVKVMALLKDNTDKVVGSQTLMKKEFDANTKLTEAFNIKMETFGAEVDLAKKEINGLIAVFTAALLPAFKTGIELIVSFVLLLKALPKFLNDNKIAIGSLVVAMLAFNAQSIIAQANILRTNFNLLTLQVTTRAYALATGIATAAQTALNIALTANPIGLVVAAIALLIGSLSYLYTNSEKAREVMDTMWQTLKGIANTYIEVAKIMYDFYTAILTLDFSKAFDTLQGSWDRIKKSFAEGATPVINKPSLLLSNDYKQKQAEGLQLFPELAPKKKEVTKEQSPEDLALIEANKKRAKELEEEEKKKQAEKDAKAREALNKKNEERRKLTEQALKDLQEMELQMMEDGQEKELLQLKNKYQELYGQVAEAQEKGLSNTLAVQQTDKLDKLQDAERQKILEKYRQLGIDKANAEQDAIVATKKQLAEKELAAIEANKANKDAKATLNNLDTQNNLVGDFLATDDNSEKAAIQEQIKVADFDHKQVLLDNETWFQEQKLAILQKYGLLTEEQENAILLKQKEAEKQKTDNTIAEAERRRQISQAEFKATLEAASGLVGALGNLQNALGKDGEEWIDFKNALTLAQIGIDTASAISSLTAASSANPTNAVTFGAAGAIQFATGIVSIMANVAKATSILSGANKPKAPTSKAANTGSSSGSGESRYFDGGYGEEPRRLAEGYTGGSSIYEPIPMIAHGGEYIIPNWLMKTPPVANFVNMVEAVRTGRNSPSSLNNTQKTSPQDGFFEGGLNPSNTQSSQKEDLYIKLLFELTSQVEQMKNTPIKSFVVVNELTKEQLEQQKLDEDARI